uniref:PPM-type phosphatase domain-containing protein n=1 Tax=Macrostomum lignano TaxID=282301 RepID=A0A1I8IQ08_9PLAT
GFGDHDLLVSDSSIAVKPFLSCVPQVVPLRDCMGADDFVVMATDGLWDVLSNEAAEAVVKDAVSQSTSNRCVIAAQALVGAARGTWQRGSQTPDSRQSGGFWRLTISDATAAPDDSQAKEAANGTAKEPPASLDDISCFVIPLGWLSKPPTPAEPFFSGGGAGGLSFGDPNTPASVGGASGVGAPAAGAGAANGEHGIDVQKILNAELALEPPMSSYVDATDNPVRDKLYLALEEYCRNAYPDESGRFSRLLLRLPALRSIGLKTLEHLFFFQLSSQYRANIRCDGAIDGNTAQYWSSDSCSHSSVSDPAAWWQAEFSSPAQVDFVTLWNRADCCPERLANFQLLMDGVQCASYSTETPESVFNVSCGLSGRVLGVQTRTGSVLTICEIRFFQLTGLTAPRTNQHQRRELSCKWLIFSIERIYIFTALLSVIMNFSYPFVFIKAILCVKRHVAKATRVRICDLLFPRSQMQTLPVRRSQLSIVDFRPQLMTQPVVQPLMPDSCQQSSEHSLVAPCGRAIDGSTAQYWNSDSCSATNRSDPAAWWQAEFGSPARVDFVTLWNRADCCPERLANFQLLMDGVQCASYFTETPESVFNVSCGLTGRVLRVQTLTGVVLTICEIRFFQLMGDVDIR